MLHYLDDLDSKLESMRAHFEREAALESPWTSYNASLSRPLLDTGKFLRPKPQAAEPKEVAAAPAQAVEEPAAVAATSAEGAVPLEKHIEALQNKFKPAAKRDGR
jgi:3'-5' exoribonuclease